MVFKELPIVIIGVMEEVFCINSTANTQAPTSALWFIPFTGNVVKFLCA